MIRDLKQTFMKHLRSFLVLINTNYYYRMEMNLHKSSYSKTKIRPWEMENESFDRFSKYGIYLYYMLKQSIEKKVTKG